MKKNVLTAVVSGAMVGCLAIGGTFAFLTANSGKVNNTFTGVEAIKTAVREQVVDGDTYDVFSKTGLDISDKGYDSGWLYENEGGVKYGNVVPGAVINKDVDVKVDKNPTPVYLFIKVSGLADTLTANIDTAVWTHVGDGNDGNGIYVYNNYEVIDSSKADVVKDVFDTVSVNEDATLDEIKSFSIDVTGAIVQANGGIEKDEAFALAKELLK